MKNKHFLWQICIAAILGSLFLNFESAHAQPVNIINSFTPRKFADYIHENFDTNHDWSLQDEERLAVTELDLNSAYIYEALKFSPDLFPNLRVLRAEKVMMPGGAFSNTPNLEELSVRRYGGDAANIANLRKLKILKVESSDSFFDISALLQLERLTIPVAPALNLNLNIYPNLEQARLTCGASAVIKKISNKSLKNLILEHCALESGDFSGVPSLVELSLYEVNSSEINLMSNSLLQKFSLQRADDTKGESTVIKLGAHPNLTNLRLEYGDIGNKINLGKYEKLDDVTLNTVGLKEVATRNNAALDYLDVSHVGLNKLDLSGAPALWHLHAENNELTELDLSNNLKLHNLWLGHNKITELDLSKNVYITQAYLNDGQLRKIHLPESDWLLWLRLDNNFLTDVDFSRGEGKIDSILLDHNSFITMDSLGRTVGCSDSFDMMPDSGDESSTSRCPLSPSYVYERDEFIETKAIRDFDQSKVKLLEGATIEDGHIKINGIKESDSMYRVAHEQCKAGLERLGLSTDQDSYKCATMDYDNGINGSGINHIYLISAPGLNFDSYPDISRPIPVDPAPKLPLNPETLDEAAHYVSIALAVLAIVTFGIRRLVCRR